MQKKRRPLKNNKRKLLRGSYDLYIINACNLHCKGCSVLDYNGRVTIGHMTVEDVVQLITKLDGLNVILEELKVLGGEPTLHKEFDTIIGTLLAYKGIVFKKLTVVTNGLLLKPNVVETLKLVDHVIVSVYPNMPVDTEMRETGVEEKLSQHTLLEFWPQHTFEQYGVAETRDGLTPSGTTAEENWNNCWQKDNCLTLTTKGLYHCTISMNEDSDIQEYTTGDELVEFVERGKPLDMCSKCPWPPKMGKWSSLKPEVDSKNYLKGVELIHAIEVDNEKYSSGNDNVLYGKRIRYGDST